MRGGSSAEHAFLRLFLPAQPVTRPTVNLPKRESRLKLFSRKFSGADCSRLRISS
jgi:hypothetical protein